jgi:hypothetical protein
MNAESAVAFFRMVILEDAKNAENCIAGIVWYLMFPRAIRHGCFASIAREGLLRQDLFRSMMGLRII